MGSSNQNDIHLFSSYYLHQNSEIITLLVRVLPDKNYFKDPKWGIGFKKFSTGN